VKALILAVGQSKRIHFIYGDRPKCLIPFNNSEWTILDQQIHSLFSTRVEDIGIVVGYEKDQIARHMKSNYCACFGHFRFIENPEFAETNNIYSLWLAREWLNASSFVCLNGDVAFDSRILLPALSSAAPITMIVDPVWRDEAMKVTIARNRVIRMSEQISRNDFGATYTGITVFEASVQERLFARVGDLIHSGKKHVFFNVAVQQLADEGVRVAYTETGGLPWAEIDDLAELALARLYVFPKLSPVTDAA
jgi:choline kinase